MSRSFNECVSLLNTITLRARLTSSLRLPADTWITRSEHTEGVITRVYIPGVCLLLKGDARIDALDADTIQITQPGADQPSPRTEPPAAGSDDTRLRLARIEQGLARLQALLEQDPEVQQWLGSAGAVKSDEATSQPVPGINQPDTPAEPVPQVDGLGTMFLRLAQLERRIAKIEALFEKSLLERGDS